MTTKGLRKGGQKLNLTNESPIGKKKDCRVIE
jgi:hypothetical protein